MIESRWARALAGLIISLSLTLSASNGFTQRAEPRVEPRLVEPVKPSIGAAAKAEEVDALAALIKHAQFNAAMAEPRTTEPSKNERQWIKDHPCCAFSRPKDTQFGDVYTIVEKKLWSSYFGSDFIGSKQRFVLTTDDTSILAPVNASGLPNFIKAANDTGWTSMDAIGSSMRQMQHELGKHGRIIMVGHQEHGKIVVRHTDGDQYFEIAMLQQMATDAGLELLIWSCKSASHATGGIMQEFREKPLVQAIISSLKMQRSTLGEFLNDIARDTQVQFAFNAMDLQQIQKAKAIVIDRSGHEVGQIDMPVWKGTPPPIIQPSASSENGTGAKVPGRHRARHVHSTFHE